MGLLIKTILLDNYCLIYLPTLNANISPKILTNYYLKFLLQKI